MVTTALLEKTVISNEIPFDSAKETMIPKEPEALKAM
jgi:hypothetical protein